MEFKFAIGDMVRSSNGATRGIVTERTWHEFAGGRRIHYIVNATSSASGERLLVAGLHGCFENELEADESEK